MASRLKKNCRRFLAAVTLVFAATLGVNLYIVFGARNFVFNQIADLPQLEFALVLGTEPLRPDGSINLHFINRTIFAAKIYLS